MLETIITSLFRVLDISKTGAFKRVDLNLFITFLLESCDFKGVGHQIDEQEQDKIMRECNPGIDLNKINEA